MCLHKNGFPGFSSTMWALPVWSTERPWRWSKKPWNATGPSSQGWNWGNRWTFVDLPSWLEISPQKIREGEEGLYGPLGLFWWFIWIVMGLFFKFLLDITFKWKSSKSEGTFYFLKVFTFSRCFLSCIYIYIYQSQWCRRGGRNKPHIFGTGAGTEELRRFHESAGPQFHGCQSYLGANSFILCVSFFPRWLQRYSSKNTHMTPRPKHNLRTDVISKWKRDLPLFSERKKVSLEP